MATPATPALPSHPGPDHLVTIKVLYNDSNRRFKLPLKDLRAQILPQKLRTLLGVPADVNVILERYSDSAGSYIRLDCDNIAVYKQLYRAAKAKSKLRIKANPPRHNYLETVLSSPIPVACTEALPTTSESNPVSAFEPSQPQAGLVDANNEPRYRDFDMEQDNLRFPVISHRSFNGMFCIDCNNCGRSIANDHYHCSICEYGDYDLCPQCVDDGASCRGEGHWLIKRMVVNGVVINSTTETIPPRQHLPSLEPQASVPQHAARPAAQELKPTLAVCPAFSDLSPPTPECALEMAASAVPDAEDRSESGIHDLSKPMCNGCCREVDESNLVRCKDCEDYDLCLRCLLRNKHGHHPAHTFSLGSDRNFSLKNLIMSRCLPGRQFKHAAICDGCDKRILGARHKCQSCPDWDYCSNCLATASQDHPGHRFVPIYEAIEEQVPEFEIHYGIFCDGPLCKDKPAQSYIKRVRYKCAVCDDVDFCANCEAHPLNDHNRTHPLIKFKTPVRSVTVNTVNEDEGRGPYTLGDPAPIPVSTAIPAPPLEPFEEKQPVVEPAPVEVDASKPEMTKSIESIHCRESLSSNLSDSTLSVNPMADYKACFTRDTIADGTKLLENTIFRQTWTLFNPGPCAWPVGCNVQYVCGDIMFNVDVFGPSSVNAIQEAMETNKLTAPVEPGQSADFSVTLRAPNRRGNAISYWRLKLPNGLAIGHRLWCDIQVQILPFSLSVPSQTIQPVAEDMAKAESPAPSNPERVGSGMIFPRLQKESPESSTYETVKAVYQAPTLSTASEGEDVLEDVESLTLDEATSTDAGFLTDEEYDVLDASDQEFLEAKQSLH
ncbi:Zinc finger ZZ-type [Penicillium macrosclerotiorum]|uniref:Zinc finger ZZ-type n=1 Tax=Penicillium macrosclerotiorum TaxID=303699 RepID=UPI0025499900|nr:Zinc finger ZZ-type [Penicillium macrosclerotiorum]KAJ5692117.1 Zinc finger ZZ-type [Penicillium macrosclerotiorum]